MRVGDASFDNTGDYGYGATRELRLEESFEDRNTFFRFDWDLECTVTADVDTRKRTVANIEVLGLNSGRAASLSEATRSRRKDRK